MEPIEDYILNFLARKETPEDVEKLKEWLEVDPSRREELKQWLVAWDTVKMIDTEEEIDVERAYERFEERSESDGNVRILKNVFACFQSAYCFRRIAAIFVVGFLNGLIGR